MGPRKADSEDLPFVEVSAGPMRARILEETGPRIIGLEVEGFGEVMGTTDVILDGPLGPVPLIGGHRLWSAPEFRASTYVPDTPVRVSAIDGGVRVESDDARLTLTKAIEVHALGDVLVIDHILVNGSDQPIEAAAWGLTTVRPGGTVAITAPQVGLDEAGLQARFAMVTWPYTDLNDPRLTFDQSGIQVVATGDDAVKVGAVSLDGQVRYSVDGLTFIKRTEPYDPGQRYPDLGAVIQTFVGRGFCEIETVGPLRLLSPGEAVNHRETWEIV